MVEVVGSSPMYRSFTFRLIAGEARILSRGKSGHPVPVAWEARVTTEGGICPVGTSAVSEGMQPQACRQLPSCKVEGSRKATSSEKDDELKQNPAYGNVIHWGLV